MKNKAMYHRPASGKGKGASVAMRSPRLLLFAAYLIGIAFIGILWWNLTQSQANVTAMDYDEVIATVDGEAIVEQEVQWQMKKLSSHTDGNLEVKLAEKRELALNKSIQLKAQLIEAQRRGLVESVRFTDYVSKWQAEHTRKKVAALNNEIVYGPITVEEDQYYDFFVSDILAKLRNHIMAEKPFSLEEIAAYYQEHLSLYKKPNRIQTNMFAVTFGKELSKSEALRAAQSMSEGLKRGESAEQLLVQESDTKIVQEQRVFNEQTAKQDTMNGTNVWRSVQSLRVGDISNPIEENGSYYIFQCLALEDTGFLQLEKASPGIEIALMEQAFPRMTERWVNASTIEIKSSNQHTN